MALGTELGLDEERLHRRVGFLRDRAQAHLEQIGIRREMSIACAGSLLRDAAATAILVEDYEDARELLVQAGKHWASIGLFSGYALLSIAQSGAWWSERRSELQMVSDELAGATRSRDEGAGLRRREGRPMLAGSAASPRQLLHLYQSLGSYNTGDSLAADVMQVARKRLSEQSAVQVGISGAPVRSYIQLLDSAIHGDFGATARDALLGMVLLRAELLDAAREDEYHWRLARAPAALVDFDLIALATVSADARNTFSEIAEPFEGRSGAASLPIIAARALRPNVRPDHQPRFR